MMPAASVVKSVCPYCGVGCGLRMEVADGKVVKVSGDKSHPSNFGRLCTKGSTCAQPIDDPGRLSHAYLRSRREQDPVPAAIDQAIAETAGRLRRIVERDGPDAIALYVSGQMSLEAQYLANKLAKGWIGTRNIESNSRLCMAGAGSGYKLSLGSDGPPGSYQDFDRAELFFVIGANMADCHPILFLRMMDRVKAGARLIVVDPRRSATAEKADLFLQITPGTDLALLNGLLHLLVANGRIDQAFIAEFTEGWEAMPGFLADYPPATVARITGLAEDDIRKAADWIGQAPEWMSCWTMGLNQSTRGTWHTNALCNLHLATGAICRPGSGPFSLTGQPNAMGGREMGYMGPGLPGQRSVLSAPDRAFVEQAWKLPAGRLRAEAGGGTVAMFEDMAAGRIKACWIICTNPVATVPDRGKVIAGLQAAELVITQDAFLDTETNRYADILLPGALWAEADGVMINSERSMTLAQQAVAPPGEALPDWQIIARVACAMGYGDGFGYASAAEVFEEIKGFWNPKTGYDIRGASHERLRQGPLQWPCSPDDGQDRHPLRYINDGVSQALRLAPDGQRPRLAFATDSGRAVFFARPWLPPAELPDEDFPFVLNTGRLQHQWHTLTKTGRIATLNKLNPGPFLELHPEDAKRLGIAAGDRVEVRSRRGCAVLPASISERVRAGNCFAPFHWNDVFGDRLAINALTSDAVDEISLQPELKFCAVSLLRVTRKRRQVLPLPAAGARPGPCRRRRQLQPCLQARLRPGKPSRNWTCSTSTPWPGCSASTALRRPPWTLMSASTCKAISRHCAPRPRAAPAVFRYCRPVLHWKHRSACFSTACWPGSSPAAGSARLCRRRRLRAAVPAMLLHANRYWSCGHRRPAMPRPGRCDAPSAWNRQAMPSPCSAWMPSVRSGWLQHRVCCCWPAPSATAIRPTTAARCGRCCVPIGRPGWPAPSLPCWRSATPATTSSAASAASSMPAWRRSARTGCCRASTASRTTKARRRPGWKASSRPGPRWLSRLPCTQPNPPLYSPEWRMPASRRGCRLRSSRQPRRLRSPVAPRQAMQHPA